MWQESPNYYTLSTVELTNPNCNYDNHYNHSNELMQQESQYSSYYSPENLFTGESCGYPKYEYNGITTESSVVNEPLWAHNSEEDVSSPSFSTSSSDGDGSIFNFMGEGDEKCNVSVNDSWNHVENESCRPMSEQGKIKCMWIDCKNYFENQVCTASKLY